MTAFLDGVSVVELGDGIAGSVAAATLAELGATVIKAVSDRRPHQRHEPRLADGSPAILATLDRRKQVRSVEEATAAAVSADIVIVDLIDGALAARDGDGVTVVITPFGLTGPKSGLPGGELVAAAAGGLLGTLEPEGGGLPVSPPGYVALRAVGAVAALAALHGLDDQRRRGEPTLVDVSAQEAVVFTGALPECAHIAFRCPGRAGSGRYVAPSGAFPCVDGLVRITAVENHQWQGMVRALGSPDWVAGLEDRPARAEHAAMITERVAEWTKPQPKASCAQILQDCGVPATPVNLPGELLASPQLAHRGSVEHIEVGDEAIAVLGPPWQARLLASQHDGPTGLRGLRVVELTHVLAGPIVGALLGGMGADVVRIEDLDRLDIYRRTGPFADGIAGPERGAYFAVANHSKRSVAARGDELNAAITDLVETCDVLVENVGQSRLDRLGVDIDELAANGVLTTRVSGFGSDGPLADYKVYANNVQAYGGLAWATRDHNGELARFGSVLADPLSSVIAATVVAAWALGPSAGQGGTVDLAMVEVVAGCIAEYVAAASTGLDVDAPRGNDLPPHAPHGVYELADGRSIAIAILGDDEWERFVDALGTPPTLQQEGWTTSVSRFATREALDDALRLVLKGLDPDKVVSTLTAGGVRAAVVARGPELLDDPHLSARGFFPTVAHPELGRVRIVGLPWRFEGGAPMVLEPAPVLGSTSLADALEAFRDR